MGIVEEVLGAEKTIQLRDGLLTEISLWDNEILDEGEAIGEALKVNTSLTEINLGST